MKHAGSKMMNSREPRRATSTGWLILRGDLNKSKKCSQSLMVICKLTASKFVQPAKKKKKQTTEQRWKTSKLRSRRSIKPSNSWRERIKR